MPRYIEADELRRRVKEKTNPYGKPTLDYESGVKVLNMIDNTPTADVVPKSEVEQLQHKYDLAVAEREANVKGFTEELEKANAEIETLKDNNEHLAVMLEEAKCEVEKLQNELVIWKQNRFNLFQRLEFYETARQNVASKIFAEIENIFTEKIAFYEEMKKRSLLFYEITYAETMIKNLTIYLQDVVELKKKYTEENDDRL